MKFTTTAATAALTLWPSASFCSPLNELAKREGISSCGDQWMPANDVEIAGGGDKRKGFNTAVDEFCDEANGNTVESQGYLSMATEVFVNYGKDPSTYGLVGFVYFEIHNKGDSSHTVESESCKGYLKELSKAGAKCSGSDNGDTKGGTWQVGDDEISYHALQNHVPPKEDALNKLFTDGALSGQSVNTGDGPPLDPWPLDSLNDVKPVACHSHNDYDRDIPLFDALSAGCVGVEADVYFSDNDLLIGHDSPKAGRTLRKQYIEPLRDILDHNGNGGVFKANPSQSLTLLVDFKSSDDGTLDALVASLDPLREKGYLSHVDGDSFVEGQITVVASGNAPFDRISSGDGVPNKDVFYDADVSDLGGKDYKNTNSYYASANFQSAVGNPGSADMSDEQKEKVNQQVKGAHDIGLKVRYWDLSGDYLWEPLMDLGVDRLNADDLADTARLKRIE